MSAQLLQQPCCCTRHQPDKSDQIWCAALPRLSATCRTHQLHKGVRSDHKVCTFAKAAHDICSCSTQGDLVQGASAPVLRQHIRQQFRANAGERNPQKVWQQVSLHHTLLPAGSTSDKWCCAQIEEQKDAYALDWVLKCLMSRPFRKLTKLVLQSYTWAVQLHVPRGHTHGQGLHLLSMPLTALLSMGGTSADASCVHRSLRQTQATSMTASAHGKHK